MKRLVIAALLSGGLAGCGHSPPTRFFTLDPTPGSRAPVAAADAPVQLDAVHIPAALDRPQVVTQIGPNRLGVSDQDQWGAPLGEMMRRTLAQDLLARLPPGVFVPPGAPRPPKTRALVVNVLQLQAGDDGQVVLQATWSLLSAGSERVIASRTVQLTGSGSAPGAAGQAEAISRLLGDLASRITDVLVAGPN